MNSYLLNRSQGSILPSSFHTAQCARLVHAIQPAVGIRFSSARSVSGSAGPEDAGEPADGAGVEHEVWAHKAGVSVLAADQLEKR
jgi:DNA excision repair protein ERCC-8